MSEARSVNDTDLPSETLARKSSPQKGQGGLQGEQESPWILDGDDRRGTGFVM